MCFIYIRLKKSTRTCIHIPVCEIEILLKFGCYGRPKSHHDYRHHRRHCSRLNHDRYHYHNHQHCNHFHYLYSNVHRDGKQGRWGVTSPSFFSIFHFTKRFNVDLIRLTATCKLFLSFCVADSLSLLNPAP